MPVFSRQPLCRAWSLIASLCCALAMPLATLQAQEPAAEAPAAVEPPAAEAPAMAEEPAMPEELAAETPAEGDAPAEDAFGDTPAEGEAPADEMPAEEEAVGEDTPAEGDAAAPRARRRAATTIDDLNIPEPTPLDIPAVQAVLESNPQTPFELLRAIRILIDLGHPQLAAPLLDALSKQKLDPQAKAAVVARMNSGQLLKLANHPDLGAKLGPIIDDLVRSARQVHRDPKRLAQLVTELSDADENTRAKALHALMQAGEASVAPLVTALADPKRAAQHRTIKRLLVALDDLASAPLVGVLESPDAALKTQVVEVLGAQQARSAVVPLLAILASPTTTPALRNAAAAALVNTSGSAPSPAEAGQLVEHSARRWLEQARSESGDFRGEDTVWHWDPNQQASVPITYDQTGGALSRAVHTAYLAHLLDPSDPARRRLYLTALLQAAKWSHGFDKPLPTGAGTAHDLAAGQGADVIEDVLAGAMAEGYLLAAAAATDILGEIGSVDLLARGGGSPSVLARAAAHSDRRLRFAATGAIMKINPVDPFAGSSAVTENLVHFAGSYGTPRALVAHPLSAEGQKLVGILAALGYQADVAATGKEAYELAVKSPDYEFVLIHSAIDRPAADELLAQLRRDRRTSLLPVGFIAPLEDLPRVTDFARRAGRAEAFLQPQKEAEMKIFMGDLLARAGRWHVPAEVRRTQALAALGWLEAIAQRPQRVFNLQGLEPAVITLLYSPELAAGATRLLSAIATDKGQEALIEMADSSAQPLGLRRAAVAALTSSIRDHGILLTSDQLRHQYAIYNANAGRDPETHKVLGELLDVLEQKSAISEEPSTGP